MTIRFQNIFQCIFTTIFVPTWYQFRPKGQPNTTWSNLALLRYLARWVERGVTQPLVARAVTVDQIVPPQRALPLSNTVSTLGLIPLLAPTSWQLTSWSPRPHSTSRGPNWLILLYINSNSLLRDLPVQILPFAESKQHSKSTRNSTPPRKNSSPRRNSSSVQTTYNTYNNKSMSTSSCFRFVSCFLIFCSLFKYRFYSVLHTILKAVNLMVPFIRRLVQTANHTTSWL